MKEMRLDKYLATYTDLSRKMAKQAIRKGRVQVGEEMVREEDRKIKEEQAVSLDGVRIQAETYVYYMMNKCAGVVSARTDSHDLTVVDQINPKERVGHDLFPIGRLDKDTEGLLFLSDDGPLSHRLLSPRYHVEKTYYVEYEGTLTETGIQQLQTGMDIGGRNLTKPAKWESFEPGKGTLTLSEGKYHQVKRMIACAGGKVTYLKRIAMAGISLDRTLKAGEYRRLTESEVKQLQEAAYGEKEFLCSKER